MSGILVLALESNIALAAVRSFARHSMPVIGVASTSKALGLYSKHLSRHYIIPWDKRNAEPYIRRIFELAVRHDCTGLVTPSETMMLLFNRYRESAPSQLRFCFPPTPILERATDKVEVLKAAAKLNLSVPRMEVVTEGSQLARCAAQLRFPLMLKFASVGDRPPGPAWQFKSQLVGSMDGLADLGLRNASVRFPLPLLVQEYAHGRYESIGVAMQDGMVRGAFQWAALREYEAGLGSFRVSLRVLPALLDACAKLLRELGFNGVAEVEFRHDVTRDQYTLMEVNPRLWGGVAFSIACGVDFPWLSYLIATGRRVEAQQHYAVGSYSRNLSGDCQWLMRGLRGGYGLEHSNLRVSRTCALWNFLASLAHWTTFDQESLSDPGPLIWTVRKRLARLFPSLAAAPAFEKSHNLEQLSL